MAGGKDIDFRYKFGSRIPNVPDQLQTALQDNFRRAATEKYVQAQSGLMVPKSVVDAAGDLIVGTVPDAVGRLPKGANGSVLTVDNTGSVGWNKPTVNALPSSPYDGQVAYLSPAHGTIWALRWNASSLDPRKWEFIGGPLWTATSPGHLTGASASHAYTGTSTGFLPRSGLYSVTFGARMWASAVTHNEIVVVGGGHGIDPNNACHSDGMSGTSVSRCVVVDGNAGDKIHMYYRNLSGATWNSMHRFISIVPICLY